MLIQVEQKSFYVLVTLRGRIDAFNLEQVKGKMRTLIKAGKKYLALELSEVGFLSLAATLEFEKIANELQEKSGQLYIVGDNQRTNLLQKTFRKNVVFVKTCEDVRMDNSEIT